MVDLTKAEQKVLELEAFFSELVSNSDNQDTSSTGAGVEYGLDCVLSMKKALASYGKKPANKHLKSIYYGFTAVVRGVESFNNYDLEKQFRELTKGTYAIQEELEQAIKW